LELIAAVLAPLIASLVVAVQRWLQARITPERLATVSQLARVATGAAEEIGRATNASPGDKFTYAEGFLKESARRVGIKLSEAEANAFIHSVLEGRRNAIEDAVREALNEVFASIPQDEPAEVS
jgi:hypothetical protein